MRPNGFAFEVVDKPNRRDRTDGRVRRGVGGEGRPTSSFAPTSLAGIAEACRRHERYDLIFVDPPTFSNSRPWGRRSLGRAARPCGAARRRLASVGRRGSGGLLLQPANLQARSRGAGALRRGMGGHYRPDHSARFQSETSASTNAIWVRQENNFRLR